MSYCKNCNTALIGEYCHQCGQRRLEERLTLASLLKEVARRVFRFDKALVVTFWRMLYAPGRLVSDHLEGRRAGYVDPIYYFVSSMFVQVVVTALTQTFAPALGRSSAIAWLGPLVGVLAVKVFAIFWMGAVWKIIFRPPRYNLAEVYVFAFYAFGTTGLLWSILPVLDVIVPFPLGANALLVTVVTFLVEVAYMSYAVWQSGTIPLWKCAVRVTAVLAVNYGLLIATIGTEHVAHFLLPAVKLGALPNS